MTDITEEDRERARVWLACITPDGQVDEATVDDYFAQLEVVRAQAREEGVVEGLRLASHHAESVCARYPNDVFLEPPPGEHGETVAACSARAARRVAARIAVEVSALANKRSKP